MRGRRPGRPTKWLKATLGEPVQLSRTGITFEVWDKWKKKDRKVGTLTVSVGGLRWWPENGRQARRRRWDELDDCFANR
jgi:hypothetical protein